MNAIASVLCIAVGIVGLYFKIEYSGCIVFVGCVAFIGTV